MGYYTHFTIETTGIEPDKDTLETDFNRITNGYSYFSISDDTYKWYDWESNMKDLSLLYPSTIFHIWANGEYRDDTWYAVICNGECRQVYAELTYPEIDIKAIGSIGERHPEFFI